jgi:hypothetical protein
MDDAVRLLESVGEAHWSRMIRSIERDGREADRVLGLYGGMGSFNDPYIRAFHGHDVRPEDEEVVNEKLRAVQGEIYDLADDLARWAAQRDRDG